MARAPCSRLQGCPFPRPWNAGLNGPKEGQKFANEVDREFGALQS